MDCPRHHGEPRLLRLGYWASLPQEAQRRLGPCSLQAARKNHTQPAPLQEAAGAAEAI